MTGILFVGSSPEDLGGICTENTTTNARDADFTTIGSRVDGDFDATFGTFSITFPAPSGDLWMHFLHNTNSAGAYGGFGDGHWMIFWSGGTEVGRIDLNNDLWFLEGGGESTAVSKQAYLVDTTYDFKCTRNGTTVTITMYINGIEEASISYASSVAAVDRVTFDHSDLIWNTSSRVWYYSEFIVTDGESTIGWRLAGLDPLADGAHTAWDGTVAGVQEFGDGQSISIDAVDIRQSWTLGTYAGPATASGVRAVVNKFTGAQGGSGSGPTTIVPFTRHTATDEDGTPFSPDGTSHMEVLDNDPNTAAPWDTSDLAAMQVGVKSAT